MFEVGASYRDEAYPERRFDCKLAIAPAFLSLAHLAERLGWRREEVSLALFELAKSHLEINHPKSDEGLQRMGVHLVR